MLHVVLYVVGLLLAVGASLRIGLWFFLCPAETLPDEILSTSLWEFLRQYLFLPCILLVVGIVFGFVSAVVH